MSTPRIVIEKPETVFFGNIPVGQYFKTELNDHLLLKVNSKNVFNFNENRQFSMAEFQLSTGALQIAPISHVLCIPTTKCELHISFN